MANDKGGGWFDLSGHGHPQTALTLGIVVLAALGTLVVLRHLFGDIRAGASAHAEI